MERILARAWSELLGIEGIGIHDSFLQLGGHSLLAAQAMSRIGQQFHVALPLRELFETPTIAALAASIEAAQRDGDASSLPAIVPIPRDGELPLSLNQEALWFLDRLEPDRPTYMLYLALNVKGPLDVPALERALREIGRRHEVLRTTFPEQDGAPVQAIAPEVPDSASVIDLSHLPPAERETELRRRIAEEMGKPIDLQHGPLVRIALFRRGENDYAVVASTHHIIHDGWSMGVLLGELAVLYPAFAAGREVQLPELPIQYVDFAAWQRQLLQGERLERLRSYWREQLAGVPPLELPDRSAASRDSNHARFDPSVSAVAGNQPGGARILSPRGRDAFHGSAGCLSSPAQPLQRPGGLRGRGAGGQPQPAGDGIADRLLRQRGRVAGRPGRRSQFPRNRGSRAADRPGRLRASGDDAGSSGRRRQAGPRPEPQPVVPGDVRPAEHSIAAATRRSGWRSRRWTTAPLRRRRTST